MYILTHEERKFSLTISNVGLKCSVVLQQHFLLAMAIALLEYD